MMSEYLDFSREQARRAGQLLCEYADRRHTVRFKSSDIDVVTEADLASERLLVDAIRAQFPQHKILSEEGLGDLRSLAGEESYLWLVDPLDGTVNYAHGYPFWGVTLALAERGRVVMGVIYDPQRKEMFWAERGRGAWCDGRRIQVSDTMQLRDALVATGFAYKRATLADTAQGDILGNNLAEFGAVMPQVQGVRRAGAAVLDLAHLADGRLDAYWEMYLNPWDWAAGSLLVEEAGGLVTDQLGEPWSLGKNNIAASNGHLHDRLLSVLAAARG
jgi:myo-inositol-1(or 4)-monophosphatase